jgi:exodeoxyribonuclease VII large subunit
LENRLNIRPIVQSLEYASDQLSRLVNDLRRSITDQLGDHQGQVEQLSQLLASYSPNKVLERGYTYITDNDGLPLTSMSEAGDQNEMVIHFQDGKLPVRPLGENGKRSKPAVKKKKSPANADDDLSQGSLFDE